MRSLTDDRSIVGPPLAAGLLRLAFTPSLSYPNFLQVHLHRLFCWLSNGGGGARGKYRVDILNLPGEPAVEVVLLNLLASFSGSPPPFGSWQGQGCVERPRCLANVDG